MINSPFTIALKLYGPFLLATLFVAACFLVKESEEGVLTLSFLGNLGSISVPISSLPAMRGILVIVALLSLFFYFLMDCSTFYPSSFDVEAFYDSRGLDEALSVFDQKEKEQLHIAVNYDVFKKKYYQELDLTLSRALGIEKFFDMEDGAVHSTGKATFRLEKITGIQRYHIVESGGDLNHTLELPNKPPRGFYSLVQKLPSKADFISPGFSEIILKNTIILRPIYKQVLAKASNAEQTVFHHTLIGVTKAKILPWPRFYSTIYFADFHENGLVPIAYAVFRY